MNKQEIIIEICKLCKDVSEEVFHNILPNGCFCKNSNVNVDESIIDFIKISVAEKIKKDDYFNQ